MCNKLRFWVDYLKLTNAFSLAKDLYTLTLEVAQKHSYLVYYGTKVSRMNPRNFTFRLEKGSILTDIGQYSQNLYNLYKI